MFIVLFYFNLYMRLIFYLYNIVNLLLYNIYIFYKNIIGSTLNAIYCTFIQFNEFNLKPTHIPLFPVHPLTLTLARCIGISFESRNSFQKINIQIRSQVKVRVVKAQFPLEISAGSLFLFSPFFLFSSTQYHFCCPTPSC